MPTESDFVVVSTYSRSVEAQLAALSLEKAGIPWRQKNGVLRIRNELRARVFRRAILLVPAESYEAARGHLGLDCAPVSQSADGGRKDRAPGTCPECGQTPSWWAFFLRRKSPERGRRCDACGHWWENDQE